MLFVPSEIGFLCMLCYGKKEVLIKNAANSFCPFPNSNWKKKKKRKTAKKNYLVTGTELTFHNGMTVAFLFKMSD